MTRCKNPTETRENWLKQRLETMHRRWSLGLDPAARTAYRAFREAELADPGPSYDQRYADYAQWFNEGRRAKVGWAIDVVFGAGGAGEGEECKEEEE